MKYIEFNVPYTEDLWIYRLDDGSYYVGSDAPTASITKAKFNDKEAYIKNDNTYIDVRKFPFTIGKFWTLTNDGLLLVDGQNNKTYLFDVLGSVDSSDLSKNLTTLNNDADFLSEDGIKSFIDSVNNKDGFFTKLWKYVPLHTVNNKICYKRTKQFKIGNRIYYTSPMEEDDPMDENYPGFYYTTDEFQEFSEDFIMDYKYFYIIESDKSITVTESTNNFEFEEDNVRIEKTGSGPYYYIIKYLYNLYRQDKTKTRFKIKATNASYIRIL